MKLTSLLKYPRSLLSWMMFIVGGVHSDKLKHLCVGGLPFPAAKTAASLPRCLPIACPGGRKSPPLPRLTPHSDGHRQLRMNPGLSQQAWAHSVTVSISGGVTFRFLCHYPHGHRLILGVLIDLTRQAAKERLPSDPLSSPIPLIWCDRYVDHTHLLQECTVVVAFCRPRTLSWEGGHGCWVAGR